MKTRFFRKNTEDLKKKLCLFFEPILAGRATASGPKTARLESGCQPGRIMPKSKNLDPQAGSAASQAISVKDDPGEFHGRSDFGQAGLAA